jgi:hypothetical protein
MQRAGRHIPKGRKRSRKYPFKKILAYGAIAALVLGVGLYFTIDHLTQASPSNGSQETVPRAAIVDQLSVSQPNQAFVEECTALLTEAGFVVDYYKGESVTVKFYKNLPTHDYSLILLRVHSATFNPERQVLDFFTSEPYSESKYVSDQLKDRVRACAFAPYEEGDPVYFGITAKFVRSSMKDEFNNTMVIMMGCDGLKYDDMAEAFVEEGAQVYIGWSGLVSAPHTDQVTIDLLQRFLIQEETVEQAVTGTMNELGADPKYESTLSYYPTDGGNSTIHDILNQ